VENKTSYLLSEKGTAFSPDGISSEHVTSELEPVLQAADAVAGAYFQKYEHKNDDYVKLIEEKVGSFKYLEKMKGATPILVLPSHNCGHHCLG
jgi:hypothetical protein